MVRNNQKLQGSFQSGQKEIKEIKRAFLETIRKGALISPGDRVVVGVSGGADSVFLLYFLIELQKTQQFFITVAHYNHCLRAHASDGEQRFVGALCKRWNVPFATGRWEAHGTLQKISEEKARQARYAFFEKICKEAGANKIALAHTRDDDVETILFRLLRGSGLSGLRGIPQERPMGPCRIVRPLKDISRGEIRNFLRGERISWCEDASNEDLRYTRNRIRHSLLPLLEKDFNPNIREILVRLGENVTEDYDYLQKEGEGAFEKVLLRHGKHQIVLKRRVFQTFPLAIQKQLFRQTLRRLGTTMDDIGYSDWRSVAALFGRKTFRYTLPGPLYLQATPTKVIFTSPAQD